MACLLHLPPLYQLNAIKDGSLITTISTTHPHLQHAAPAAALPNSTSCQPHLHLFDPLICKAAFKIASAAQAVVSSILHPFHRISSSGQSSWFSLRYISELAVLSHLGRACRPAESPVGLFAAPAPPSGSSSSQTKAVPSTSRPVQSISSSPPHPTLHFEPSHLSRNSE